MLAVFGRSRLEPARGGSDDRRRMRMTRASGRVLKRTEQHAVSERLDCDRTVIRQGQNLEEHRGLRRHAKG